MTLYTVTLLLTLPTAVLPFSLDIYHTNDIHARYDERGPSEGGKCSPDKGCYGGMPRHAHYLKNKVDKTGNNLILSGGDWFTGTTYFTVYKGNLTAHYLDELNYDAWALGNHEFDQGPELLAETVNKIKKTKTVVANMVVRGSSGLLVQKSTIKEFTNKDGTSYKVGIIGYITPETTFLSSPGPDITFSDAVEAVKEEAAKLKEQGVDIIVAVGHAGIGTDLDICDKVDNVDVVVGGHSNTFLWTGDLPEGPVIDETIYGPYPMSRRGDKCLVVQAYAYGKFLGHLSVNFSSDGAVESYSGNPILMWGEDMEQDEDTLKNLEEYLEKVKDFANVIVGSSESIIDGTRDNCRAKECELGNVLSDAYLESFRANDKNVVCCLLNSGSIRASIPEGDITFEDILTVLPFGNTIDKVLGLNGTILKEVLEHSVSSFDASGINVEGSGRYLQLSGIQVYYNLSRDLGDRVDKIFVQNPDGKYEEMVKDKEYQCVGPNYLLNGGDGFTQLGPLDREDGAPDVDIFKSFLAKNNPLSNHPALQNIPSRTFFKTYSSARSLQSSCLLIVVLLGLLS
ncbi:snake venom 5'-nucleotidase-like [Bolinopsis microptera]|uniref:snake venom 5'-nucleotidase-like n=1 Tax=Bolinopsis microptera TaxID=2820187 RepID=UPI0030798767